MKQLSLSAIIDLPEDVFAAAQVTASVAAPWAALLVALKDAQIGHVAKHETIETRAKPATGARRGRKARVATGAEVTADA